jgi:hypothetical protein
MTEQLKREQIIIEPAQEGIVINATAENFSLPRKIIRICWNTGEEKNCPACYLIKGCKSRS